MVVMHRARSSEFARPIAWSDWPVGRSGWQRTSFSHIRPALSTRDRRPSTGSTLGTRSGNRRFIWASPVQDRSRVGTYHGGMTILRWTFRALVLALAVGGFIRLVGRLTGPAGSTGSVLPTIGGDTWPPVPVKEARPG